MKRVKKIILLLLALLAAMACFLFIGILYSRQLKVTRREVPLSGITQDVRLVLLSDLHETQFGEENSKLLELVRQQVPDLILLAGDVTSRDSSDEEIEQTCQLMSKLVEIAPVYHSLGNHETGYLSQNGDQLLERFAATGAILLEDQYVDLHIGETAFRLGGMSELAYRDGSNQFWPGVEEFLTVFCDTDLPTVLLSHRPEAFCFKNACSEWSVDLILSGHTHGGLVRLPFIGGVIAPIQGWSPKVDYGEYTFYNSKMIVTSGLAGYHSLPRVFNKPEVCLITLIPE